MKATAQFQLHVERFARWHALLTGFDLAVALAVVWNVWQWRGHREVGFMGGLSLAVFLLVLAAQFPYWKTRAFTLVHGASGWKLLQGRRQQDLAEVRGLALPGQILVLGMSAQGRVVLPVSSDISPTAWRELRTRLAL
ncbi:MAG: hypothetical protein HKL99_01610 [Burkholderiales bacterium]|jgi:hypothetical protein|nr:hypothetical protein [Burkholderiales bacterium]